MLFPDPKMIDVVVLCGGLGTRLREAVNGLPKSMADFHGRPFLDLLINYIYGQGFKRFILCTGYKGQYIEDYYQSNKQDCEIIISRESESLGTAGALKNAEDCIKNDLFLGFNGDSICKIDFKSLLIFHQKKKAVATIVLALSKTPGDYGLIQLDRNQEISVFHDKSSNNSSNLVSAGIYVFNRTLFSNIPKSKKSSLEIDILPQLVGRGLYGYLTHEEMLDIGTPERLEFARQFLG